MSLTLNQIWPSFCRNIQSSQTTDFPRKINAINLGLRRLIERMIFLLPEERLPGDLLATPTNISNSDDVNYVSLPSDFLKLHKVWYLSGSLYQPLTGKSIISFDRLLNIVGSNFFDSDYTGDIVYAAVKEPYLYFDKFFDGADTDGIKISYFKNPAEIVGYNNLAVTSDAGIEVGDTITGGTSNASAEVYAVDVTGGTGTISYYLEDWNGVAFTSGETITGSVSADTATAGATTAKPETFEFMDKYKNMVVEAAGLMWHVLKGTDEIEGRAATLDIMINEMSAINMHKTQTNWGYMGSVR